MSFLRKGRFCWNGNATNDCTHLKEIFAKRCLPSLKYSQAEQQNRQWIAYGTCPCSCLPPPSSVRISSPSPWPVSSSPLRKEFRSYQKCGYRKGSYLNLSFTKISQRYCACFLSHGGIETCTEERENKLFRVLSKLLKISSPSQQCVIVQGSISYWHPLRALWILVQSFVSLCTSISTKTATCEECQDIDMFV